MLEEHNRLLGILFFKFSRNPEYVKNIAIFGGYLVPLGQVAILVGKELKALESIWRVNLKLP